MSPEDEEDNCHDYDCSVCYPNGVKFVDIPMIERIMDLVKHYEM